MESQSASSPRANRLSHEKSPYLLQHADNPVDWYPWGEEAFEKARKENRPIFLSVGYSTCHWCHVMEKESFEDAAVAELLNKHFVSIKVDREERTDVDHLYMQAVMQMTGQGGWPLSVFLTPDLKPFYGGTYFPPEDRWGQPGFKSLLRGIAQAWEEKREEILRSGEALTQALRGEEIRKASQGEGASLSEETLLEAFRAFSQAYDEQFGGFEPAPKFPRSHSLSFLLRVWRRTQRTEPLEMVEKTLQAMAAGGVADHLGGGFHRYSTDAEWFLPHFEKMLYDQALLAGTYLEAHQATGKQGYAQTAREIFEYLLRQMRDPAGGFYSAEDADSAMDAEHPEEKREGAFYVWTAQEIREILGQKQGELFAYLYGVQEGGNVAHDPMGEFDGKNVLRQVHPFEEAARKFGMSGQEIRSEIFHLKQRLFERRDRRPRPHRDDKVLVDWNGLVISSLATGSRVLGEPRYAQAAGQAAEFILANLVRPDGRLLHRWRKGEAGIPGTLEDYAFLIHGLVDLYQATFQPRILAEAKQFTQEMLRLFWDEERGGFFMTGGDAQELLFRPKELYDGAIPSGNSVAALDLLRVGRLTADPSLEQKVQRLFRNFSSQIHQQPSAYPQLLIALDFALGPSQEIVIAGFLEDSRTQEMLRAVCLRFLPNKVMAVHPPGKAGEEVETLVPFLKGQEMLEGKPTAYVCQNYACDLPTASVERLEELLKR